MRGISCLVALAGASLIYSQDLSVKITYTSPASSVNKELEAIGKVAKVNLATSADMAKEIVVLKVHDMPLSVLMNKIALVTTGSWIQESNGYRLVADSIGRRQEQITARLARVKKFDEQIKKLAEPIDKPMADPSKAGDTHGTVTLGTGGGSMFMNSDNSPAGRALVRLIRLIGSGPFADLQSGDRAVWASNANRSQIPLPGGSEGIIQRLVDEQRVVAQAAAKNKTADNTPPEQAEMAKQIQQMMGIDPDANTRMLNGPPAKVLLTAARENIFGSLSLTLVLYDTNGKVLLTSRQTLSVGGGFLDMEEVGSLALPGTTPSKPAPKTDDTEIALTPLSKEMQGVRGISGLNPGSLQAKIPDDLKAAMLKPDERDPLSFGESEATMAYADSKKEDLIAELPEALLQFSLSGDSKLTLGGFESRLKKSATITEGPGLMLIKPTDPVNNRATRVDRKSLANFLRSTAGKEFAPLDSIAQYSLNNAEPSTTPASNSYFMIFAPDAMQAGIGGRADWNMLRLFATLPEQVRQTISQGRGIPLGALNPEQQGYATKLLFGAGAHLQADSQQSGTPNFFEDALAAYKLPTDYRTEPTEAMPNGLPQRGTLTLSISNEPVAKSTSQGMIGMAALGVDELAMLKFFSSTPQFAQAQAYMPNLNELRIGSRVIYHFTFHVAQGIGEKQTLMDNSMPANAQPVAMANLPADMQKMIDDRVAAFKKMPFFNAAMFGGGRVSPP